MSERNASRRLRHIGRVFVLVSLLLISLDMPITLFVDASFTRQLRNEDISNAAKTIYFFIKHPEMAKVENQYVLRTIENERMQLNFSSTPTYKKTLIMPPCSSPTGCMSTEKDIEQAIKDLHKNPPYPVLKFSYYISPVHAWLNFNYKKRTYPLTPLLIVVIEIAVIFIAITYLISVYRFTNSWQQICTTSRNLGIPLSIQETPILGKTIINESIYLINAMTNKIQQLIHERVKTIASLSHDIRTPLTRAQLYLNNIQDKKIVAALQKQFDEIQYYLNETLSYAKQDYQDEPKRNIDIVSLIETVCEDLKTDKNPIFFHSSVSHFSLFAQRIGLTRVFRNLIENGIKYGNTVKVNIIEDIEGIQITIDDDGPGLPENMLEKVFEPFFRYQQENHQKSSGTGLGLVIAKSIIENNNGKILLVNNQPKGLRVIAYLWKLTKEDDSANESAT